MREAGLADVVENPDHAQYRRRINALTQSLVIEADVSASDRNLEFLAGFGDAINRLRKLPHDMRLFGIAEVQAIGRAHGSRSRAGYVACGFSDRVHGAQFGIEVAPTAVAIERHGQSTLRTFDPNDSAIAGPGAFDGVGLHHGIVLLVDPALAADVRTGQQALEVGGEIGAFAECHMVRLFARDGRFPTFEWAAIYGGVVGEG